MDTQQNCFDDRQFSRFLQNQSEPQEEARVLTHIADCQQCQAALERLAGHQEVWSEIRQHLANEHHELPGEETREHLEAQDRKRDLAKIEQLLGPTDNPEMLGRIGGYEVCGMIGRGSAGVVVKALDTRLNRYVAIKLLAPVYSNNGSSRRRFEREGRAIASVKDPNVIPVHTVGDYQGTPYIVMQYVPDGSLQQRIDKHGPLTSSEVVCVGMQIAKGLAAAHQRGIVHRDVKPANVLLESGVDCAMVTDFGLARVVDEATMTRSGAISGTPQYMSPEQAKGESVDPRSDLFSLGSVMYAACTGHSPFRAESVFGVIKRVCDSQPRPIRETNPEIPLWLTTFISKLHAKRIEDRFASANEVAELLGQEIAHIQAPTMVAQSSRAWMRQPVPPVKNVPNKPSKPVKGIRARGWTAGRVLVGMGAVVAVIALGLLATSLIGNSNANGPNEPASLSMSPLGPMPWDPVAVAKQENEDRPQFKNSVETTIDVKTGGTLVLHTNLGSLNVVTHDKPTVEMKMTHTASAKDQDIANKLFKAVTLDYKLNSDDPRQTSIKAGRDAVIVATFPTQKLTQEEIEQSTDLGELKEQLLIRNNSHFRNAEFELRVPQSFNLDLESSAGPMQIADVDGTAKLITRAGHIEAGNITGQTNLMTNGGHITTGDLGFDSTLFTNGGHIQTGAVEGNLIAKTNGGQIDIESVKGIAEVESNGGEIDLGHMFQNVKATSTGGGIKIWIAEAAVTAKAPAGSISVNFTKQPTSDSKLHCGVGSIRVGYVKGLSFAINSSCGLGKISAPFVEDKKSGELSYELNGGKTGLTATTGNGSIKFRIVESDKLTSELANVTERARGQRAFQRAYDTHMAGHIDRALELHREAAKYEQYKGIAMYNVGCAWALKGDKDNAFAALNDAITYGFDDLGQFKSDGDLDSIRKDSRFEELMLRLTEPVKSKKTEVRSSESRSSQAAVSCNDCQVAIE